MKYTLNLDISFRKNPYPGRLIVLEGIDGSGKSYQVEALKKILAKKHTVYTAKNPTDNPIGKFIQKILTGDIEVPSPALQYLYAADRHAQEPEILNHLKRGHIVLMDRYYWSAVAYGIVDLGASNRLTKQKLLVATQGILSLYHQQVAPDATFYLKLRPEVAMKRLGGRASASIYEKSTKLQVAAQGYDWLAKLFPREISVIDGEKTEKEVTQSILDKLQL